MAEANAAEPNERAAPSPRRPRRKHVINLCCAQSVHRVVEEVARSLEGLGFHTTVVTGAEARAALLGSRTDTEQPTIHVVCVQGSMQERVLKPLRQALATHGGPNHHLFVAVLDLGVPLAMVGQIRRFAEALERPALGSAGALAGGREPSSAHRDFEQSPTRSYPSVAQVVERGGTKPPVAPEGDDAGEQKSRRARPRVAKLSSTSKYQAVTATNPAIPAETGVRKRRREPSRLRPSARRQPSDERVLGLPEHEQSRPQAEARREPPPPPPVTGESAKRSSSTALPQVAATPPPPPLLTKTPSSTSLPAVGARPPEPPKLEAAAEPDRAVPRVDPGFRFSPPGVKAADAGRPRNAPAVPVAEVRRDPDKTVVEGVRVEVPRTASTLRLDEPPFGDGSKPRERSGASHEEEEGEPVEPTMILAAPRGAAAIEIDEEELEPVEPGKPVRPPARPSQPAAKPVSPAAIVGSAPLPPATTGGKAEDDASTSPRKTIGYMQREAAAKAGEAGPVPAASERAKTLVSESSRTLVHHPSGSSESSGSLVLKPRSSMLDDEPISDSSSRLVQRPMSAGGARSSSESSGTLVLKPRTGEAKPSSESSGTLRPRVGGATPSSESSGTLVLKPRIGGPAPSSESSGTLRPRIGGPSGTVVQPAPTSAATAVSESEKTLRRSDGTFESARDVMQKAEASRRAQPQAPSPSETPAASAKQAEARAPAAQGDAQQGAFKAGKTVLYADSAVAPVPTSPTAKDQGGTVVTPKPSAASPSDQGGTVVAPKPAAATPSAPEPDAPAPVAARKLPSAIPTERHPTAEAEPEGKRSRRSRVRKGAGARSERSSDKGPSSRSGALSSEAPSLHEQVGPRDAAARPRTKSSGSRYGWLWIMLALLTAGGGWGAYQAGLFDDLLGRRSSTDATVADAGAPRQPDEPTPSDTAPRTSAGEAGAAEPGSASTGPTEADSAPPATTAAPPTLETGDEPASTGDAPDATTGEPDEPVAASAGTPDEPADTRGPDEPTADDGTPERPPTTGGEPEPEPPTDGPRLSPEEQLLSAAVDQRRIFMFKTLYATRRQGEETTFAGAWQRCAKLEVDGVERWRLPHRREMKLVNAVLNLPEGVYWTRTVPPEDKSSAYVLDTADGSLSLFLKEEPSGDVVCVRERDYPEK